MPEEAPPKIVPIRHFPAPLGQAGSLPSLIVDAGENAAEKFIEFFTAQIRNRNTREAYARAVGQFMAWCEERCLSLPTIRPVHVAAYIEKLSLSRPTVLVPLSREGRKAERSACPPQRAGVRGRLH
jgi:hypothetical protein